MWDYGMCADTSRGAAIRDLIAKALKGPLAPQQQEADMGGKEHKLTEIDRKNCFWALSQFDFSPSLFQLQGNRRKYL
ncbi:hypothetical protein ACLOJK_019098 [Asimina triloba]